jgi:hypothetical protein
LQTSKITDSNYSQTFMPNDSERWQVHRHQVVDGGPEIVICDNFFSHPELLRDLAFSTSMEKTEKAYPGVVSPSIDGTVTETAILGLLADSSLKISSRSEFSSVRLNNTNENLVLPHLDANVSYVAYVFLNKPEDVDGGTAFYEKTRFGLRCIPPRPDAYCAEIMRANNLNGYEDFVSYICQLEGTSFSQAQSFDAETDREAACNAFLKTSGWEPFFVVPMVFNRLVITPGNVFHRPMFSRNRFNEYGGNPRLIWRTFVLRDEIVDHNAWKSS